MTDRPAPSSSPTPLLAANALWSTIGSVVASASLFFIDLAFIRAYGSDLHGEVFWALSVVNMAMLLCDLGLTGPAGIRRIARSRDTGETAELGDTVSRIATLSLAMSVTVAVVIVALANVTAIPERAFWLRILAIWVVLLAGLRAGRMVSFGFERIGGAIIASFIAETGRLFLLLGCILAGAGVGWVLTSWTLVVCAGCAVGLFVAVRILFHAGIRIRPMLPGPRRATSMVAKSLPYFTPNLWLTGLPFLMLLIVGHWHRGAPVSVFKICLQLAFLARMLITPLTTILLPRLSWAHARGKDEMRQAIGAMPPVARLQAMVVTLAFAGILAIGEPVLGLLYGPLYAREGVAILLILVVAVGVDDFGQILDQLLLAGRHVRAVNLWEATRLTVLGILAFQLVPSGGPKGAAWALLAAVSAQTFGKILTVLRESHEVGTGAFLRMLIALGILAFLNRFAPQHPAAHLAVAVAAWFILTLALRLLRPFEVLDWTRTAWRVVAQRRA